MIDLSLLQDFITEANEHLEEMESSLLKLEKDPDDKECMNDIFRAIHTIKGASMFVGLPMVSELSHKMENLLDLLRQGEKELSSEITDVLIDTKDRLTQLTKELEETQEESSEIADLLERILSLSGADEKPLTTEPTAESEEEAPSEEMDLESALEAALDTSMIDDELDTSILGDDIDSSILDDSEEPLSGEVAEESTPDEAEITASPVDEDAIRKELMEESYDEDFEKLFII